MEMHFLQTPAWQKFQEDEGRKVFREKSEKFEYMAILRHTKLGNYLFVPYGPVLKDKKALKPALESLKKLAAEQNAIFIRIEPTLPFTEAEMTKNGLKKK